jgi:hypothetical protein
MNWGIYGLLVIFGLFILLLIFSPNLTCFGRRVRSPLYPLFRSKRSKKKAEDYGFHLVDEKPKQTPQGKKIPTKKTEDYGFRLD